MCSEQITLFRRFVKIYFVALSVPFCILQIKDAVALVSFIAQLEKEVKTPYLVQNVNISLIKINVYFECCYHIYLGRLNSLMR